MNRMNQRYSAKAVVVGDSHHNTLGIIRSLGEKGVPVYAVIFNREDSFVAHSKYLRGCFFCHEKADELHKILIDNFGQETEKVVIIPSCDSAVLLLSEIQAHLEPRFCVGGIVGDYKIKQCMNKLFLGKLAETINVEVPRTTTITIDKERTSALEQIAGEKTIRFPIIVKPLISACGSKNQIFTASSMEEANPILCALPCGEYLVQELIDIEEEYGLQGISIGKDDCVIIPGIVHKLRKSLVAPGSTTYAALSQNFGNINLEKLKEIILLLGYRGVFDIELMYSEEKYYLIEINFRNGAYGYAYTKFGYNLPFAWYLFCAYDIMPSDSVGNNREIKLINETADFLNVTKNRISFLKWLMQLFSADVKLLWNWKDMKPFFVKLLNRQ